MFWTEFFSVQNFFFYPKIFQTQIFFQINKKLTLFPSTTNNQNFKLSISKKLEFVTEDQLLFQLYIFRSASSSVTLIK